MNNILTDLVDRQAARYADRPAIYRRLGPDNWVPYTWIEMLKMRNAAAAALEMLNVKEGSKIAVFSANDPLILVADFGAFANRAIPVSIYATSSAEQVEYIVRDSESHIIFTGNQAQYECALAVKARCPELTQIITFKEVDRLEGDTATMSFAQFLQLGEAASADCLAEVQRRTAAATADDVATLLYTSGTTGEPKGAILPHSCFNACLQMHHYRLTSVSDSDTSMCFLPLSHILEKAWTYFCLDTGITVYVNSDPRIIADTIREVHPSCMCAVPRFWEKAYATINDKMAHMKPLSRLLCRRALKVGERRNLHYVRQGLKVPRWLETRYQFYYKRVFGKVQKIMGVDRGNIFPTAGAPLSDKINAFFHSMGVNVMIGYGLSETTATVACFPSVDWQIGTVGTVLDGLTVRIGDNSEVLVKGATVMRGYHNRPKDTAEAFTPDGFFRTGDAGYFNPQGALVLTERIKDLFKTSNGKYIAPQAIESRLGQDPYIEQAAVIGDNRKYVTALIVPAIDALKEYAQQKRIQYKNIEDLVRNTDIHEMIEKRLEALQEGLAPFEKIKKFTLLPKEFTMDTGELTNTLKIRRPVINRHYARLIDAMYP